MSVLSATPYLLSLDHSLSNLKGQTLSINTLYHYYYNYNYYRTNIRVIIGTYSAELRLFVKLFPGDVVVEVTFTVDKLRQRLK